MGNLTVDDQVLATLTEIAAREGLSLDELSARVLGDFVRERQFAEDVPKPLSVSKLIAEMSHELRTQITVIKGYSHLLLVAFSDLSENEIKRDLETIHQSAHILMQTINELYELARTENGYPPTKSA